jgi:transcriptional regulator NrdR family protein
MNCPKCGSDNNQVVDSRDQVDAIRRRRKCLHCFARFTTMEIHAVKLSSIRSAIKVALNTVQPYRLRENANGDDDEGTPQVNS